MFDLGLNFYTADLQNYGETTGFGMCTSTSSRHRLSDKVRLVST